MISDEIKSDYKGLGENRKDQMRSDHMISDDSI